MGNTIEKKTEDEVESLKGLLGVSLDLVPLLLRAVWGLGFRLVMG